MALIDILLSDTYTQDDFKRRMFLLRSLVSSMYFHSPLPSLQSISHDTDTWLSTLLGSEYKAGRFTLSSQLKEYSESSLYTELQTIEQHILTTPPLDLFLPYPLSKEEISHIGNYLRTALGVMHLLRLSYDSSLIAGCALSFKGVYKDYSLKKKMKETAAEREEIIRKVLSETHAK